MCIKPGILLLLCLNIAFVLNLVHKEIRPSKLTDVPKSLVSLNTGLGTVVGYRREILNRTTNVFYGLPFAEPPVGKLRFRKTKLITKFANQPYSALVYKPHCIQKHSNKYHPNDTFSEDCLYLNIFTPDLKPNIVNGKCNRIFSVIVYFLGGTSSIYQMSPFLDSKNRSHLTNNGGLFSALHDIIFITFNSRIELLASLYVDRQLKGNIAFYDQNLALQWTREHIGDYCGDGEKITVLGHTFGARLAGIHMISKYSKHLISNAILHSGAPFFRDDGPVTKNELMINSLLAIRDLKCLNLANQTFDSLDEMIKRKFFDLRDGRHLLREKFFFTQLSKNHFDFHSNLNDDDRNDNLKKDGYINEDVLKLSKFLSRMRVPEWLIFYDFDFIDTKAYFNYKLFNKINLNPKVNLLTGFTGTENCDVLLDFVDKYPTDQFNAPQIGKEDAKEIIRNFDYLATKKMDLASSIVDYYTNETVLELENGYADSIINVQKDQGYCGIHFFNYYASMTAGSVSSYYITQKATKHFASTRSAYDLNDYYWLGPCHADDLMYIFGWPFRLHEQFTQIDRSFALKLLELWSSFVKDGKMPNLEPSNIEWPVANKQHPNQRYVEINAKFTREREFEFPKRCDTFWRPLLHIYKR